MCASSKTTRSHSLIELLLQVLGAAELIEAGDQLVVFVEGVAGAAVSASWREKTSNRRPNFSPSSSCHCSTRLPGATIRQRSSVAAQHQLADVEPGHDGLASTGIVGQHEAQRLARQHGLVDGGDLVRQRLDVAAVHRHHRVEQVGEMDALGLGGELEVFAVGIEGPERTLLDQTQRGLVIPQQHPISDGGLPTL